MNNSALSFEMVGVVVLSVILAIVLVAYDRLLRKTANFRKGEEKYVRGAEIRAEKIVEMARLRAQRIMDEAIYTSKELKGELNDLIEDAQKSHVGIYKEMIQNISEQIEEKLEKGVEEYSKILETETIEAQKTVAKKIEQEYKKLEDEIAIYRNKRVSELDEKMLKGLSDGLRRAFEIEFEDKANELLVRKAIENAKNQNII